MSLKILALETSGVACSVSTLEAGKSPKTASIPGGQRSAQALAPAIERALQDTGWRPEDVELVAVTSGPGSFTGLRIGVTTAKTIAYTIGAQIVGVDTLAVISHQQSEPAEYLTVVLDAYRGQLFSAEFRLQLDPITNRTAAHRLSKTQLLDIDIVLNRIPSGGVITGPGLPRISDQLPAGVQIADPSAAHPHAPAVAELALEKHIAGQLDNLWELTPRYLRRSAAEEKLGP